MSYEFYTFPYGKPKIHKVVLRGLPIDTDTEVIQNELIKLRYPIESIRQLKRRILVEDSNRTVLQPIPLWLISTYILPDAPDIHKLTGLFHLKLTIEDYKFKQGPLQCYKCQGFGHKADACFIKPKCVKCAKEHLTKDCDAGSDITPTCANCLKQHTANFKECPKYINYIQGIERNRSKRLTNNFTPNSNDFPSLPTRLGLPVNNSNTRHNSESNSLFNDIKEFIEYFKNIKVYMNKFRNIFTKFKNETNGLSKILILAEGICEVFDSTQSNGSGN